MFSQVDQIGKDQRDNRELTDVKSKQHMPETLTEQAGQQGLTGTAPKPIHSGPKGTQKTNGPQSLREHHRNNHEEQTTYEKTNRDDQ